MSHAANDSPTFIERRLALRRWTRRCIFCLAALLIASVLAGRAGLFGRTGDDWAAFDGKAFDVVEVPGGDALVVSPDGGPRTRVSLVGLDAPDEGAYWFSEAKQHVASQ